MDPELIWTLKTLILPPGGIVLMFLLGLLLSRRRVGKLLLLLAPLCLYLLSTPFVAARLMTPLEGFPALTPDTLRDDSVQAIVVLGSGIYTSAPEYRGLDTVGSLLLERIRYAAWLQHHTDLPIIPSGGNPGQREHSEAYLMQQVLQQEFGAKVPALEEESRTTWENAEKTGVLLQRLGIRKVFLVTHAWHMPRAMNAFRRTGIEPVAAPTGFAGVREPEKGLEEWLPSANAFNKSYYALHEHLGGVWYRLRDTLDGDRESQ